ncbi:predicted protein [Histoplasma capsulatum H143]|uniref:Uncharacterized protein n=1 Tax=Ajellomyces capsulatus (strain H143) TaxID=544712 RepID=C6HRZ2_AJECH|nr:predicted protein [Histoplasma capsulatum H143]
MTPIFVTRDIFDREGMTGRLSGMALDINTTSWQKRSNMDESGRENNPMLSAIAPVGKVDFDLLSLGVILKKGRGKNQFMNGGSLRTGLEKTKFPFPELSFQIPHWPGEQGPPATSSRTKHSARPGYCRLKRVRLGTGQTVPQSHVDSRVCSWFVNKGWER